MSKDYGTKFFMRNRTSKTKIIFIKVSLGRNREK